MQQTENAANEAIAGLLAAGNLPAATKIERLAQQGSDRIYFRVHTANDSFIATYGNNKKENQTFVYLSKHFAEKKIPVPAIFAASADGDWYLQQDFGDDSLLHKLEQEGFNEHIKDLYKKSLSALVQLQLHGDEGLDYDKMLTSKFFGKEAIMADLLYFKYYFLDALAYPYDKQLLLQDFDHLSTHLSEVQHNLFLYRDFQSRNIMVDDNDEVHFIDYQGGMQGAPQYDVASLLWQAKANLSQAWKDELWAQYVDVFKKETGKPLDEKAFADRYNGYVLIRLLQVLGAYGFRGLFERKAHFLTSIPLGLKNLASFLSQQPLPAEWGELKKVLAYCSSAEVIEKYTAIKATADSPLHVTINSFSYLKNGYPSDPTENGGGFVFDCRGILNPGRIDEYKTQSGEDKPVQDYLENNTKMNAFLQSVFSIVDISVEDYLQRNFESLMVNFGCTGGQHRSVYAANALARHLKNKFGVAIEVRHLNKENWKRG